MNPAAAYGPADRLLHRLAFAGLGLQKALADLEGRLHAARLHGIAADRPVFVTALPRAGTTLLLEALAALPGFATHTYRDMPFVLCPLLWDGIARSWRKPARAAPRAHGDGMLMDYDSPEAFEEVAWRAFWPAKYGRASIAPWAAADRDAEFEGFLRDHMRKIVALRVGQGRAVPGARYLSKNNANVARLALLAAIFPGARFVVPFRDPAQHVASLRRQHARFLAIHDRDPFALRYMTWLGHLEFGRALKPIAFPAVPVGGDPGEAAFWYARWEATYRAVLAAASPQVALVDYDRLCAAPRAALAALAAFLGVPDAGPLLARAERFRAPTGHAAADAPPPAAAALHAMLRARSLQETS